MNQTSATSSWWQTRGIQAGLLVAALIHLAPLSGLRGAAALADLYGLPAPPDAATTLLLLHRALTFALLAGLLLIACVRPALRTTAIRLMLASDLLFIGLVLIHLADHAALLRVAVADVASVMSLVSAWWLERRRCGALAQRART